MDLLFVSLHIKNQSLQIFPFWVINVDRMVSRLCQLVQDAYATSGLGGGAEHGQAEVLLAYHLRAGEGEQDTSRLDLFESDGVQFAVTL